MKLVAVIAFCATLVALAVVVIVVPTTIASVRRARERAEIASLSLHTSAVEDVRAKVNNLVASTRMWIDVLERAGGMDIPWSLHSILPTMWATLRDDPVAEQLTFGANGDEGVAMDDPISLEGDGWEPTATKLKIKIQNHPQYPEWACRGYYAWNSEQPRNFSRSRFLKDKCSYSYPSRGWFRKITAMTKNATAEGDNSLVATEIEPNNSGQYTTAAAGRYVRSRDPTQNPSSTMEGVAAVDFSTRVINQAFGDVEVSKNGVAGIFVVASINRGDIVALAPSTEPVGRKENASDPDSDMAGLKQHRHLDSNHVFHKNGALVDAILQEDYVNATQTRKSKGSDGERLIVNFADVYALRGTLHWRVIMLTPEEDFTAEVNAERNLTLGICIPVALLCIVFQCVVMYLTVARPLEKVSTAMGATANLQEHEDLEQDAFVSEIAILQAEYAHLREAVMCVKAYVPQSLIHIDALSEEEEAAAIAIATATATASRDGQSVHSEHRSTRRQSGEVSSSTDQRSRHSAAAADHPQGPGVTAHPGLNLSMGTSRQRITVLAANLRGYHTATQHLDSGRLSDYMNNVVSTVSQIAANHGGVVDLFHGDHFYLTFNAIRRLASHAQAAAQVSLALHRQMPEVGPSNLKVSCGFATGLALIGNVGSTAMRRFCHIGHVFTQATLLERGSRLYEEAGSLTIETTFPSIEAHFYFECVDIIQFAGHRRPQAIGVVRQAISEKDGSGGPNPQNNNTGGDEEWMYLVNRQEAQNPYWQTNKAFLSLAHGSLGPAQQIRDECRHSTASGDGVPTTAAPGCVLPEEREEEEEEAEEHHTEAVDGTPDAIEKDAMLRSNAGRSDNGQPSSLPAAKRNLLKLLAKAEDSRVPCSDWGPLFAPV